MNKLYLLCACCAVTLWSVSSVSAQPALERPEKEANRQLEEGGKPSGLAAGGQAFLPAPAKAAPERGYLGALLDDREDRGRGVRIMRVNPGSPAEKAGLQKGDLITALSGIRVRQLTEVGDILEQFPPETEVTFFVRRGRAEQMIDVTLGHRPAGAPPAEPQPPRPAPAPPKVPQPAPPVMGAGPPASIDALLRRIEALERDVQALKQQNQTLQQRIEALRLPAAPKPPTP
jgi:hypothetical protein